MTPEELEEWAADAEEMGMVGIADACLRAATQMRTYIDINDAYRRLIIELTASLGQAALSVALRHDNDLLAEIHSVLDGVVERANTMMGSFFDVPIEEEGE